MRVAVLGGGVIGVTTAHYLLKAGHEVTVIERQAGVGMETSFANAGEISPGYASPWAAPGVPLKALKWLLMEHAPLILRPRMDPAMASWLLAMLSNCTSRRYAQNKRRMVALAEYSRDQLIALRAETGIAYDARQKGTLQLFRTQAQLEGVAKDVAVLAAGGVPFEILDKAGCVSAEPGLARARDTIVGGLRLPNDETGDCFKFTRALSQLIEDAGGKFIFNTTVHGLEVEGRRILAARTAQGPVHADAFVIALGSYSPAVAASAGLRIPVYPVKGYSITVPISSADWAPQSTLLDETYKIAITRLGDRIRVGGMAEIAGFDRGLPLRRRATLEYSLQSLFPDAGRLSESSFWCGLRPMTPDSTPIVGPTGLQNLYLNTGHGTLGWTMACGSGRYLSDLISGQAPEIDGAELAITRYKHPARRV